MPGASQVAKAEWIEVKQLKNAADLSAAEATFGVGIGELSTILLGKELQADVALMDDLRARELARRRGLEIRGSVGILELLYRRGQLSDLRDAFVLLLANDVYIDRRILNERLEFYGLQPL